MPHLKSEKDIEIKNIRVTLNELTNKQIKIKYYNILSFIKIND